MPGRRVRLGDAVRTLLLAAMAGIVVGMFILALIRIHTDLN